jgi:hypothetical protein
LYGPLEGDGEILQGEGPRQVLDVRVAHSVKRVADDDQARVEPPCYKAGEPLVGPCGTDVEQHDRTGARHLENLVEAGHGVGVTVRELRAQREAQRRLRRDDNHAHGGIQGVRFRRT